MATKTTTPQFGNMDTNLNLPQETISPMSGSVNDVPSFAEQQAAGTVQTKSATPPTPPAPTPTAPKPTGTKDTATDTTGTVQVAGADKQDELSLNQDALKRANEVWQAAQEEKKTEAAPATAETTAKVNPDGSTTTQTKDFTTPEAQEYKKQQDDALASIDAEISYAKSKYEGLMETADAAQQALLKSIEKTFEVRKYEMERINTAALNTQQLLGARSGRQRYAPEIQSSILSEEERAGLIRITEIEALEFQAIAAAQSAAVEQDFMLLNGQLNTMASLREEKNQVVQNMYDIAVQEEARAQNRAAFEVELQTAQQQLFVQEREMEIGYAGSVATGLVSIDENGDIVVPDSSYVTTVAEDINVDPNILMGQINQRADELRAVQSDQRRDYYEQMNTLSLIQQREISNEKIKRTLDFEVEKARLETEALKEEQMAAARGELTPELAKTASDIAKQVKGSQLYKDMTDIETGLIGVMSGLSQENGFGDITAINAFQRMVDPGATVRSEDVTLLQSASAFIDKYSAEYMLEKLRDGDKLPPGVREQMRKTAEELYAARRQGFLEKLAPERAIAEAQGVDFDKYVVSEFDDVETVKNRAKGASGAFKSIEDAFKRGSDEIIGAIPDLRAAFPNKTEQELLQLINEQAGFPVDLSKSVKGIKDNTDVVTLIGRGRATGIEKGSGVNKYGFDIVLEGGKGAPVPSAITGKVVYAGKAGGFGNQVKIRDDAGFEWTFNHLDSINVRQGQRVSSKQIVGTQGNTGTSLTYDPSINEYRPITEAERRAGRGTHLDITVYKPDGGRFSSQEVAAMLNTKALA